ncbi:lysophospholipase nte1 [Ascodesmis nigricans]|uniref:Lysophospholipase NTE1 n=1 Tax=Ascodesmis nigricans TaxID=341454 RepID=A0A4S2N5P2_9PEZI|nr:lysophospholipase nte1 [Ascodesmis nigricans]
MGQATLPAPAPAESGSFFWILFSGIYSTVYLIQRVAFNLIYFTTYTLPTWLFTVLGMSLTFTMNFTTLLIIFLIFGSIIAWAVRYRILNRYKWLPPEPQRKEPEIDLFPDSQEGDSKAGFSSYLDEFLSAIKVFGYLERPVFHELTRSMQTRKLIAGETLLLQEEKGFCIVVDGLVQIFVKSARQADNSNAGGAFDDEEFNDGQQGYQLLTEVKNGAPMSSLFTILSLFTEDVRLRHEDDDDASDTMSTCSSSANLPEMGANSTLPSPLDLYSSGIAPPREHSRESSYGQGYPQSGGFMPSVPPMSLNDAHPRKPTTRRKRTKSVHPDILARATVDTTIAVIPASAFRRLTSIYPKASAHIVQVILARFQRVTFLTGYNYLGLTSEVLRTEKFMDRYTMYGLPNYLRGDALERLKEKFGKERERSAPEDSMKGIVLHNPHTGRRRRSSATLRKEAAVHARVAAAKGSPSPALDTAPSPFQIHRDKPTETPNSIRMPVQTPFTFSRIPTHSPLPETPLTHRAFDPFAHSTARFLGEQKGDDSVFREAVLECMFKAIGLTGAQFAHHPKGESAEDSPKLLSYDAKRQKAVFSNAFGQLSMLDGSDTESVASTPMSAASTSGGGSLGNVHQELKDEVDIVFFPKGSVLVEQGERDPGLYYVIDGFLDVSIPIDEKIANQNNMPSLFMIKPGGLAGYIGSITSYRSFIDVRAKTDVYVGFLPRAAVERITEKYPVVLLTMAKRLTSLLPRLILHIDFALEWLQVPAGQVLHHQGDESDAIYIVLNGRLRSVVEDKKGAMKVTGEYGQGESVGELEVMTETTRPNTIHAIRDTEIARFPKTLFNSLAQEHPAITIQISKIIASRMRQLVDDPSLEQGQANHGGLKKISSTVNIRTVCILPVTAGLPVMKFAHRLSTALKEIGTPHGVTILNQAAILSHLGRHAFSKLGKLKLQGYLADLEEKYGMVIYVADTSVNAPWTQTCISQADTILLLGLAEGSPAIGEYERFLVGMKTTARKELVLLHVDRYVAPGVTRQWLKNRMWVNGGHHHIQMAFQRVQAEFTKYTNRRVHHAPVYPAGSTVKSDFHRLARRLCGKSIGLVLGGGGARGIAHLGVIRALEEEGIPIDIVGGTSIGAFVGALYSRDADIVPVYGYAKRFAGRMASLWRFLLDLTYPSVSYTTGHEFNRGIFKTFGNAQIEDFWLEFYCNTTSISRSRMEIHNSGYAWRYIRASMSLAGLLPPLCDEGEMLLDGGYVDNLTVAHMKSLGAETVIAVDVGSVDDQTPQQFGDSLSGFWAFMNRWNPFSSYPNPPTLAEIQARLAYVSSVDALERAKTMQGCLYLRPPIDAYGTLDFGKFDEIYKVGYEFGKGYLADAKENGLLPTEGGEEKDRNMRRMVAPRRNSV